MVFTSLLRLLPRRMLNSPYEPSGSLPTRKDKFWLRQRTFRFTQYFKGRHRNIGIIAERRLMEGFRLAKRDRLLAPTQRSYFDRLRVQAAAAEHGLQFNQLLPPLRQVGITLSYKSLAQLAIYEPRSFEALTDIAKNVREDNERSGTEV